jgi:hypothetical protein
VMSSHEAGRRPDRVEDHLGELLHGGIDQGQKGNHSEAHKRRPPPESRWEIRWATAIIPSQVTTQLCQG